MGAQINRLGGLAQGATIRFRIAAKGIMVTAVTITERGLEVRL